MTREQFFDAGHNMTHKYKWSDDELEAIIEATACAYQFLEGRDDCGIVASRLQQDLEGFNRMKENRNI